MYAWSMAWPICPPVRPASIARWATALMSAAIWMTCRSRGAWWMTLRPQPGFRIHPQGWDEAKKPGGRVQIMAETGIGERDLDAVFRRNEATVTWHQAHARNGIKVLLSNRGASKWAEESMTVASGAVMKTPAWCASSGSVWQGSLRSWVDAFQAISRMNS